MTAAVELLPLGPLQGPHLEGWPFSLACQTRLRENSWPSSATCGSSQQVRVAGVCDGCGQEAYDGRAGDAAFKGQWFCSNCWRAWEGMQVMQGSSTVGWLVNGDGMAFLRDVFGHGWAHRQRGMPRADFGVEECLAMLANFRPSVSRDEQVQRSQLYARAVQTGQAVGSSSANCTGADALQFPATSDGHFWNCTLCRHDISSDFFETLEEESQVMSFVKARNLRTCEDLRLRGDGWTFILNQVQGANTSMRHLHQALFASFGLTGGFNAYLTPGRAMGKAPHSDDHDVFIVQQVGCKDWTLLQLDNRTVLAEMTLLPGDVLYIPQGLPHYAMSTADEPSLHLAVSVRRTPWTCAGILAALLEMMAEPTEPLQAVRSRIDWRRGLLIAATGPMHQLNQLLPFPLGLQLIKAFCEDDLPPAAIAQAAAILRGLAEQLTQASELWEPRYTLAPEPTENMEAGPAPSNAAVDVWRRNTTRLRRAFEVLRQNKNVGKRHGWAADNMKDLRRLITLPSAQFEDLVASTIVALREFHFEDHYVTNGPREGLHQDVPVPSSPSAQVQRAGDCAALLRSDGILLLDGWRVANIPDGGVQALKFFMGLHTGSCRQPVALTEVPGAADDRDAVADILLRFGSLVLVHHTID